MKYIRTKDEIIDLSKVTIGENGWESIEEYIAFKQDDQQEPIKVADTIEELCDYVDIQYKDGTWETYFYENEFKIKLLFKKAKQVFYGIRTNKGLIYVAKMNDKGELELL